MGASTLMNSGGLIGWMSLAIRIKEAIDASGKSNAQIARATGKTQSAVNQWLDGDTKSLKADTALALESATGYRAVWITSGKGPKTVLADGVQPARDAPTWPFDTIDPQRYYSLPAKAQGWAESEISRVLDAAAKLLSQKAA